MTIDTREEVARLIDDVSFACTPAMFGTDDEGFRKSWPWAGQQVALKKADKIISLLGVSDLQRRVAVAEEALKGSSELIDRLLHVHVAPDECTSYVKASTIWLLQNGGSLACIADQQAASRAALSSICGEEA